MGGGTTSDVTAADDVTGARGGDVRVSPGSCETWQRVGGGTMSDVTAAGDVTRARGSDVTPARGGDVRVSRGSCETPRHVVGGTTSDVTGAPAGGDVTAAARCGDVTASPGSWCETSLVNGDLFPPPPPLDDPAVVALHDDLPPPPPCVLRDPAVERSMSGDDTGTLTETAAVPRRTLDATDRPRLDNITRAVVSPSSSSSSSSDGVCSELAAAMLAARLRAESNLPTTAGLCIVASRLCSVS